VGKVLESTNSGGAAFRTTPSRSADVDKWVITLPSHTIREVAELELQIGRLSERLNLRLGIPGGVAKLTDMASFFKRKGLLHGELAKSKSSLD